MTVRRDDLERHLEKLAGRVVDPRGGIYGPGSMSWEVNRETVIMLGGGCAALMQLAHPYVAHAVDQHSNTQRDPLGRFQRTFAHVFAMVFGDLDHAMNAARRVHSLHTTIRGAIKEDVGEFARGHRYHANDEQALLWVHATLLDTAVRVYELVVRELTAEERAQYYEESKLFAYLFGIPDEVLPRDWEDFERYYARTIASDAIAVGGPAREMRRFLFQAPTRAHTPFVAWFEIFTAGLMPPKLREQFDFAFGPVQQQVFARSIPAMHAAHRVLPDRFRYFPAYVEAQRRLAGKLPRDAVGRFLEKVAIRSLKPSKAFWRREAIRAAR